MTNIILWWIMIVSTSCLFKKDHSEKKQIFPWKDYLRNHQEKTPLHYKRDSLFINFTLQEWLERPKDFKFYYLQYFHKFENRKFGLNPILHVDSILYSPDSLKLFSFVVIEFAGKMMYEDTSDSTRSRYYSNYPPETLFYDGRAVIGYREDTCQTWKLYLFNRFLPYSRDNYFGVSQALKDYYFGEFKNEGELIIDSTWKGEGFKRINMNYGYSILELEFWNKSPFWKRGLRIKGYYNFQTQGNVTPYSLDPLIDEAIINYPDSLLKLFSNCGSASSSD